MTTSLHTKLKASAARAGRASSGVAYIGRRRVVGEVASPVASDEDLRTLRLIIAIRVPFGIAALLAALLAISGTAGYWQAWAICGTIFFMFLVIGTYFLRTDPDFLLHRLQFREREPTQKRVVRSYSLIFIVALFLPALDVRFGWSSVPAWVCVLALAVFLAAYAAVLWVFKTNRYASRIVEVQPGQQVVDSGPYAIVRHPMYASQLVMFPAFMLALGSWWAALLSAGIVFPLVSRIRNEEAVLRRELPGYQAYCDKTRYRLVPYVW
jgi:protein-S-isoprenylcysteine O-methyltransferase Ste14